MNILLIGSGAREHAIARALKASRHPVQLFCYASHRNPGIEALTKKLVVGHLTDGKSIAAFVAEENISFAIVGPEDPLNAGVVDQLLAHHIPCVGPTQTLARIETSKIFARDLLSKYGIDANPDYQAFSSLDGARQYLEHFGDNYVVKYDGLMGGKGVKVAGDHLHSHNEALEYCQHLVKQGKTFLIEEKLDGEEFSLMSFCDGKHLVHMPPVQDHKRAYVGDTGPNTGGMGSYSGPGGSLPFLTSQDIAAAQAFNEAVIQALREECGAEYLGILYGGFMVTAQGVHLLEYNARFGDPEALNVLPLLTTDFVEICLGIVQGCLNTITVEFQPQATVCKYAVPKGYPTDPVRGEAIDVHEIQNSERLFYGSVETRDKQLLELGSRAVAVVGIADTIEAAEQQAEQEINRVKGPLFHREDIGTRDLIQKRVEHMNFIRG
jgi:phosphoribosylamine--glycine ligase